MDSMMEEFMAPRNQDEKRILSMQETIATDEALTFLDVDWDSAPDQTKLRINAASNVSRTSLFCAVGPWLSHFDCADWLLLDPAVGVDKDWTILFLSPTGPAVRRAKKAMQSLRNGD
eukprot:12399312-Karenia_brevis.AAC.1